MNKDNSYKRFQGYTLKELRYRMVVNSAKQQQVKAGIDQAVSSVTAITKAFSSKPEEREELRPTGGVLGKLDAIISVGNYAVAGYSLFKSVRDIFAKK
ncbi:MAG: hypothetical protein K2M07_07050 [Muribaculaceae bacterium]|nr:hypothetical protein [Muribaculaceae bacterium]